MNEVGLHPALSSGFYGALGATAGSAIIDLLGRLKPSAPQKASIQGGASMSDMYDLLGHSPYGSVGYNPSLIGADDADALLEALAVSGGLSDLLVSGAGNTEIVGAANGQQAALKQIAMRNAGAVVQRELDRRRRYPLGVVPTSVTAGSQSQIPASPQNLFRPERLVLPSDIAFDLGIVDIKVGNVSQFVQSTEVPGALFSEVAINTGVNFDTAEIGNQIALTARNKSGATIEVSAGFVGTIAK